ncbi:hypothetical protein ADIARSV_3513 [Arcticibacter svalbardensis MN12-7]|uniref:Uncharacterized protein n=1 Tax=Arcticibacter svalbardensis MN12-7 TaxID=1150600 RepID=R9GN83_9SPHI|nr:hypothetical protein ADIARSV_3513 [Arcticibacter svalbardensis MN12-7]
MIPVIIFSIIRFILFEVILVLVQIYTFNRSTHNGNHESL